jgi:hypothetical protein
MSSRLPASIKSSFHFFKNKKKVKFPLTREKYWPAMSSPYPLHKLCSHNAHAWKMSGLSTSKLNCLMSTCWRVNFTRWCVGVMTHVLANIIISPASVSSSTVVAAVVFVFFFFIAFLLLFCIFFVLLLLYCVGFKFSLPALVLFYFTVETFFLDPFQPPSMYAQLLCLLLGLLLKPFASVFMAASVHLIDSVDDLFDSFPTYVTIFNWCVKIVKLAKRSFIIFHSFVFLLLLFSFFFIVLTI